MVKDYLTALKNKGGFSWSELSEMSGLPDATIRKIFSGETADPRFDTVSKLVISMGGSLDEMIGVEHEKSDDDSKTVNAITAIRDVYEARIEDIKKSSAAHIASITRDKRFLAGCCAVLGLFVILWLVVDLMIGSVGWIRY